MSFFTPFFEQLVTIFSVSFNFFRSVLMMQTILKICNHYHLVDVCLKTKSMRRAFGSSTWGKKRVASCKNKDTYQCFYWT